MTGATVAGAAPRHHPGSSSFSVGNSSSQVKSIHSDFSLSSVRDMVSAGIKRDNMARTKPAAKRKAKRQGLSRAMLDDDDEDEDEFVIGLPHTNDSEDASASEFDDEN